MRLKKAYMASMGHLCSNCANCVRLGGVQIKESRCDTPRMPKTVYDCEHGKMRVTRGGKCRYVYGTIRCKWKAVES